MPSKLLSNTVNTRIAPSPTGFLHLGTARSALFNYLFARQQGGKFFLRIEDTDVARSEARYIEDIKDGLTWLGLPWDGKVVMQSQRNSYYRSAIEQLTTSGWAYEKDGAWYFSVAKAKATRTSIEFDDLIRGMIRIELQEIEDFVIVRSDGSPVFHLAVVVDDHEMQISHVIRGEDLLSNTPKHILIGEALGYSIPQYGHIPLILSADRSKLSKRHGAISLNEYRLKGYLPEAMGNYLALLGWHPADEREIFSLTDLIRDFSLERVQKGGAVFDEQKLKSLNRHYIKTLPTKTVLDHLAPLTAHRDETEKLSVALELIRERLDTLAEFDSQTMYLWETPQVVAKDLVFRKSNPTITQQGLEQVLERLEAMNSDWNEDTLKALLSAVVTDCALTNGDVFWPVRVALCGLVSSPPPEALLVALGKIESLKRLAQAIEALRSSQE